MTDVYFTVAGMNYYFGSRILKKGMRVKIKKDPQNKFDREAIKVKLKGLGTIGYVANSPYTVKGESSSAGRIYDLFGKKARGKVLYVLDGCAVCRLVGEDEEKGCKLKKKNAVLPPDEAQQDLQK